MISIKKEIDVFYERNVNGRYDKEAGKDSLEGDTYWNDIGMLWSNIGQNLERISFYNTSSDTHSTINSISREEYLRENKYSHEYDICIEIIVKITELTDEVRARLMMYGYDQKKSEEQTGELEEWDYWKQRCFIFDGKLAYCLRVWSVADAIEDKAKHIIGETTKNHELFLLIKNEEYREWLKGRLQAPENLILYAPVSTFEKHSLFRNLSYVHEFCRAQLPKDLGITPVSMFVLHEKQRSEENGVREISERVTIHRLYDEVKDTIREKYGDSEPDEFDSRWNVVERLDMDDGEYRKTHVYLVSEKGDIWNSCFPEDISEEEKPLQLCNNTWVLPAPYKTGDIVTIDCRPFRGIFHAVVVTAGDGDKVASPYCLWIQDGKPVLDQLCAVCDGFESVSPFYKLARYEGEMPENERIISEISQLLKNDCGQSKNIEEMFMKYGADEVEEKLRELLK